MEQVKEFLDTSTIHGLSWISSARRWSSLFWILVVIGGFSGAGFLIYESFDNWKKSPITTMIETLPISQITFPNVTVCPPKNSFLNLNYDIKQSENVKLDNKTRHELTDFALDVIQSEFYKEMIANLSKVEDPDRYYNWYHGYTEIGYPYQRTGYNQLWYIVFTSASAGNISTQYFGEKFNAIKVDGEIYISIYVYIPTSMKGDKNMFYINKKTMKEVSDNDKLSMTGVGDIDADLTQWSKNITAPKSGYYKFVLDRRVSADDIKNLELDMMPGFRFTWNYDKQEQWSKYSNNEVTKQFVRYIHILQRLNH